MTTYINIDNRYGGQIPVTIEDYKALNPNGNFVQAVDSILEFLSPRARAPLVVAISQKSFDEVSASVMTAE
jgi:hypothetical protein